MVVRNMTSSNGGVTATKTENTSPTTTTLNNHAGNMSDDDDDMGDIPSSNESDSGGYDDDGSNLMSPTSDDVRAQLAAAGPVGMAAAAAIASAKKRKRPHSFETNPSIRRRQQTRLLRKLRQTIDEYATRVGQQAIVLVASPGKPQNNFRVFGAKPLEDVVKSLKNVIIQELENALAQQAPPPPQDDPSLHELPPLVIDGIPTPVEKMTQAQLRAFIPLMLKYSTGRGKPGWGKDSTRPPWWPKDVPWANVRMDARSEDDKQRVSWTHALRQIVINCYRYHGREDLLPAFSDEDESGRAGKQVKTEPEPLPPEAPTPQPQQTTTVQHYTPTMVQTISNPDGTVSIIHVDPNNPIITLPDGTTAQVQGLATFVPASQLGQGEGVLSGPDGTPMTAMELNSMTEGLSQEGHILLTSEDGQTYPVSVSGMITVPAMYQAVVANISQLQGADGTVQLCSSESFQQVMSSLMAHSVTKVEGATDDNGMGMGLSMTPMLAMGPGGTQHHILQVTAAPVNHTSTQSEVDSSTITTINAMQVSSTDQEIIDSSPTSSTEQ